MAVSLRSKAAFGTSVARSTPRRVAVCQASKGEARFVEKAQIAAATLAAAVLLASPAQAGLVLQQPEIKKVFQDDAAPVKVERAFKAVGAASSAPAAPAVKAAPQPKKDEEPLTNGGVDPRAVALPGAIVGIAGLAFAASKVDSGFSSWINESGALVRNSGAYAGFEEDIKGDKNGAPKKAGTTKTTKKTIKGSK